MSREQKYSPSAKYKMPSFVLIFSALAIILFGYPVDSFAGSEYDKNPLITHTKSSKLCDKDSQIILQPSDNFKNFFFENPSHVQSFGFDNGNRYGVIRLMKVEGCLLYQIDTIRKDIGPICYRAGVAFFDRNLKQYLSRGSVSGLSGDKDYQSLSFTVESDGVLLKLISGSHERWCGWAQSIPSGKYTKCKTKDDCW